MSVRSTSRDGSTTLREPGKSVGTQTRLELELGFLFSFTLPRMVLMKTDAVVINGSEPGVKLRKQEG